MNDAWEGPNWERWGPLAARYAEPGPRRLLALDGGGIRGILTLRVLARLEALLAARTPDPSAFRLGEYFHGIGGTSTGAIIAGCLAIGMTVEEVTGFYRDFGKIAFTKRGLLERWKSLYENGELERQLKERFGEGTDLSPENLHCLFLAVTRNATTDSTWPISSNPDARYNDPALPDCNLRIPLWRIVRASTAAPVYFPPEVIEWEAGNPDKAFVFVDGGTTPYNCPAFLMARMATEPAYRLAWPRGERNLLVVSVGTGRSPAGGTDADDPETNILKNIGNTLSALMSQASVDQDINCRTIGRCVHGEAIDSELGDLIPRDASGERLSLGADQGRAFLYARYDAELTDRGLERLGVAGVDPEKVRRLDAVDHLDDLERIGEAVAAAVRVEDFGTVAEG